MGNNTNKIEKSRYLLFNLKNKDGKFLNKARLWAAYIYLIISILVFPYFYRFAGCELRYNFDEILFCFSISIFGCSVFLFHSLYENKEKKGFGYKYITLVPVTLLIGSFFVLTVGMNYFDENVCSLIFFYIFGSYCVGYGIDGFLNKIKNFAIKE